MQAVIKFRDRQSCHEAKKKQCPSIAKMVRAAKGNQRIALLKDKSKNKDYFR